MADRKTVTSWLEGLAQDDWRDYHSDSEIQVIATRAIALLNEQEERIGVLTRALEQMPKPTKLLDVYGDGYAKVVRCKDCKNAEILPWLDNAIICKKHSYTGVRPDDFYCADGESIEIER